MWKQLIDRSLTGIFEKDRLTVTFPDGDTRNYGPETGDQAHVAIADTSTLRAIVMNPDLGMGEGYVDGRITPRNCTLEQLMRVIIRNRFEGSPPAWFVLPYRIRTALRRFWQRNAPSMARRNVAHHYDISDDLYRLFLDRDMQYSCGYFRRPDMSLEDAQIAKKRHIANKLCLSPGQRVLDIGCGWGGMALTLAGEYGCQVTGITLSENQLATARRRAVQAGLEDRVTFELQDYRYASGRFDRVVSVGMLEHVGIPNYAAYFEKIAEMLDEDGVALIHTIGWSDAPHAQSSWINKYIFPGGHVPSLSELAPALEKSGLRAADIEVWRLHYATTLEHWRRRFEARSAEIEKTYDTKFLRMFRYYLTICQLAFEHQPQAVYQFQLTHRHTAVPITRDYLYAV